VLDAKAISDCGFRIADCKHLRRLKSEIRNPQYWSPLSSHIRLWFKSFICWRLRAMGITALRVFFLGNALIRKSMRRWRPVTCKLQVEYGREEANLVPICLYRWLARIRAAAPPCRGSCRHSAFRTPHRPRQFAIKTSHHNFT